MNTQQVDHKVLKYLGFDFSKLKKVENQYRPVLDLPPEIVYMWILESQKVGNSGDVSVLERNLPAPRQSGGFTWSETHLGQEFFSMFLRNSELATLYIQDLKINGIPYDKIESNSYNILPSKILKILRKKVPAISSDIFSLDTGFISEEDVLIFVDDIKITGSHERRIKELLERYGIKNEVIFVYLAEYTGSDPTVEDKLNHSMVKNLTDITRIITEQDFLFNTRVVKYILKNPEFEQFIKYQSRIFQVTLYNLGIMNDYHNNPKFQKAFEVLETLI